MTTPRDKAIAAAMRAEDDLGDLEAAVRAQLHRDLDAARQATIARLSQATAQWDMRQATALIHEVERQMIVWERTAAHAIAPALAGADTLGREQVLAALGASGVEVSAILPSIGTGAVSVSQSTLPWLIREVSDDVVRQVGRILRSSVLGQSSPFTAMEEIARFVPLDGPGVQAAYRHPGPFGRAFRRSESIVRTELGRVMQTSNHSTLSDLATRDRGLRKQWLSMLDKHTRSSHAKAYGQIREVDRPFRVGGEDLMYPHDPRGRAANVINCRCVSVPMHASWLQF